MMQESVRHRQNRAHHFRTGLDFTPVRQTTWNLYLGENISDQQEQAGMKATLLQGGHLSATRSRTDRDWNRLSAGTSLLHRLRREGGELSASVDAFRYRRSEKQRLHTDAPDTLQGDMPGRTNLCIAQADLTLPLVKEWKLTAGGKASYARIDNHATYLRPSPDGWQEDGTRGMHYIYKENIHAAYLEAGYEHREWRLTAGLRMEHTRQWGRFSGNTVQADSSFGHRNLHLFPNLTLQYGCPSGSGWQLSYTRRITRPNYGDLNPFVYIFDDYTYESGNTRLHPAFAHRLELVYVHRGWLQMVLWGSREADIILKCYSEREEQRAYIMFENQPLHTQAGVRLHAAELRPLRRWTLNVTATLLYNRFRYRDLSETLTNRCLTPMLTFGNRFDLHAGWSAEVNASYTGCMVYGQATLLPQGRMDLGVRKKFCGGRGTLSLFARDLLATDYKRIRLRISGREARFREVQYRRQVGIGLTWLIHRGEGVKEKRQERMPEEVKRVNP